MKEAYEECFTKIVKRIKKDNLTIAAPPLVLFHDNEFGSDGLDTEFAIAVKERAKGTRDFHPGLCLKTILHGSYHNLASIYTKQIEWAEREGYESSNALYEIYVNDPGMIANENELITEVYYPIKKKA